MLLVSAHDDIRKYYFYHRLFEAGHSYVLTFLTADVALQRYRASNVIVAIRSIVERRYTLRSLTAVTETFTYLPA